MRPWCWAVDSPTRAVAVHVTLAAGSGYTLGNASSATLSIADDDPAFRAYLPLLRR